jgi:hypothetical protein
MLVFSRKWNLLRHVRLMHGVNENPGSIQSPLNITYDNKSRADNFLTSLKQDLKVVSDISDMQNKISNSIQTSNNQNSLEWQANSLRQQLASYEKRFSDLLSNNWIFPKGAIHGISGYICKKCQTFSLKPILDLGYDMTMEKNIAVPTQSIREVTFFIKSRPISQILMIGLHDVYWTKLIPLSQSENILLRATLLKISIT